MTVVDNRPSEMIQQAKELSTKIEKAEKKAKADAKRKQREKALKVAKMNAGMSEAEIVKADEAKTTDTRPTTDASVVSEEPEEEEDDESEAMNDPLGDIEIKDAFASYSHHHKISLENLGNS